MANQIKYQIGFDVQQQDLNKLKAALQQLQTMKISDIMKINNSDFSSAQQTLKSIQTEASNVEKALTKAFNVKLNSVNIETFNRELSKSGTDIGKIYLNFSKAGAAGEAAFRNLSTQLLDVNVNLKQSHTLLDQMATTLGNTIKWNAASTVVNVLTRSVEQAWGYVKSLDSSLNNIRIVTGKSADEMSKFAVQANNAAKELGKTTTDYTDAALIFAQQGLSDEEIAERAAITLKAANVTGQSTDDVSEQLTAVWNGYKVTAGEAELYVDRLAAVAASTASNLEELTTAMGKVAASANIMGVGEDQLAAQLSTIISVTKQAPETVGTALRTIYARISDIKAGIDQDGVTLGNYSGKMAQLGFNVLDATGHLRDMGSVIEEIGGRWQDLTREQQISLAQTMAGQRQYSNLMALFDNFEEYNRALGIAQNSMGTLQQQQNIYMDSVSAHSKVLKAAIEDVYNRLFDTGTINKLIDGTASAVEVVSSLIDSIGGGGAVLKALGAIGVSVFRDQIGGSIQTTINNLSTARQQAEYFKEAIAQADWMQGLGDDYTQFLRENQKEILELAPRMAAGDYQAMQTTLKNMSANSGQIDILNEKIQTLERSFSIFGDDLDTVALQWGTLDDMLASSTGIEKIKAKLKELEKSFEPVEKQQEKLTKAFIEFDRLGTDASFKKYKNSFKNIRNEANELINILKNTKVSIDADAPTLFESLPEAAQKSIEQVGQKFKSFDFTKEFNKDPQATINSVTGMMKQINSVISIEIRKIRELIKNADQGELQKLKQRLKQLQALQKQYESTFDRLKDKVKKGLDIKDLTAFAGGMAQVSMSIQQIQNLGSIWKNADLTTGEKLLQTVTNLGFSLPMLASGFGQVMTALHITSPLIMGVTGAALLAVTAIGALIKVTEQANENKIKQAHATIEKENATQKEIEKNRQLLTSLQDLNDQYKTGEISRGDLKSAVQDLIEQYGLEKEAADKLGESYDNLAGYIQEARKEQAQAALASAIRERDAASESLTTTAKGSWADNYKEIDGNYRILFGKGGTWEDEPDELLQALSGAGGKRIYDDFLFDVNFDPDSIAQLYNNLNEIFANANTTIDNEVLKNSEIYNALQKWLTKMQPEIEAYEQALADVEREQAEVIASTAVQEGAIDFSVDNIKTGNDYLEERKKLIQYFRNSGAGISPEQAVQKADSYLQNNYRKLYLQFDELAKKVEDFRDQFGKENSPIEEALGNLDEDHFNSLMELIEVHPSIIKSWEDLGEAIEYVSKQNVADVAYAANNGPHVNVGQVQAAGAEKYNVYQSLEDQVSSGKTISKKEMESLEPEVQGFFSMMANGSYKMTGDAKEFYETVKGLKLQGFYDTIDAINTKLEQNDALVKSDKNFDFDTLSKEYSTKDFMEKSGVEALAQQQLEYLKTYSGGDQDLEYAIEQYEDIIKKQGASIQLVNDLSKQVEKVGQHTALDSKQVENLNNMLAETESQIHDALFPTDADVDAGALKALSETIQDIADESTELADSLTEDAETSEDVAEAILRFDDAIQDVVDNYDDWIKVLNDGSVQEQAEAIDGLRDAYADLLDLDGSSLSNDFLTNAENLELMKAAIDGDAEAYNQLMDLVQQDIAAQVGLDTTQFDAGFDHLMDLYYQGTDLDDMEIGASLNDENFLNGLSEMVNAAGMTAQQATDYLASMGVDAQVIEQSNSAEEQSQAAGFLPRAKEIPLPYKIPFGNGFLVDTVEGQGSVTGVEYVPDPISVKTTKQNKSFALKVTSAHKSSGGNFKFTQAANGGGSKGAARRAPTSSKGSGGSGGRGGSGSGKAAQPDTSQKDRKKLLKDDRDIYHDINIELEQINRNLDRTQKKQDRLYGKQLLDNLNKQSKILDQHKAKLQEKHDLQEQDLKAQQQTLKNLGVTFDKYNNISNYMDILGEQQAKINAKTKEYNNLIDAYNKTTNSDAKKQIANEAEKINKQIKAYEDDYKDLEDKIKKYDGLHQAMEDVVDQIEEETQKQIEINIKKFRMEIEIRLDLGQAERDWNKFRRQVLEHTDIIKDTNFQEIFSDANSELRDITSYFNVRGSKGSLQALTQQLMDTRAQIEAIDKNGVSAIYGDNKAQAIEDLKNDLKELTGQMQDIQGLIDNIDKAFLDTIDDIEDQFGKQIEDYEYIAELIENDIDLLSLLYGDENYDAMNKYYSELEKNNLQQLDSLKRQRDFWKDQWDIAIAQGDVNAAKKFEENYRETIKNLNSLIEQAAKNIQDKYVNAINKIFDELDKRISNGKGTDYLSSEWDLMNKNAEEYLDTINSAFSIQETERKYQKALDDTKSIKNQQSLKKLMDEQLNILKNKEKITQYDIDRAEKLLQVEQARIALQDSRSSKTSLRLKRDSQGNYSYEYMADNDSIQDAQSNLANAQNDLYNFDKDRYQSNLNDMLSAWRDFQQEYKDIVSDASTSEQQKIEKLALLREQYGEYINDKTLQNLVIRNNLMDSAFSDLAALYDTDVNNYNQMSLDEQEILMGDLVPAWKSGIQEMTDKVAGQGGFIPVCQQAFEDIAEETENYKDELNDLADTAGIDLNDIRDGVDELAESFEMLIEDNDELTDRMLNEIDAVNTLRAQAHLLVDEYKSIYDAAKDAVSSIYDLIQAQDAQAASYVAAQQRQADAFVESQRRQANAITQAYQQVANTLSGGGSPSSVGSGGGSTGGGGGSSGGSGGGQQTTTTITTKKKKITSGAGGGGVNLIAAFDTGGYTGNWTHDNGKIAMLHEKELVLNQNDTENILNSVKILRALSGSLNNNLFYRLGTLGNKSFLDGGSSQQIEQNVHIDANFPNIDSKREIEEAFNDLVNLAAQRAMRK